VVQLAGGETVSFFSRNPLGHSPEFRRRRFFNWFPLGLTYATMYMGRYNFNIIKNDIGAWYHLDKAQMGLIATFGFWT
jgi:OPA family glycerol-3-phosphate transporter-like MFS transporter